MKLRLAVLHAVPYHFQPFMDYIRDDLSLLLEVPVSLLAVNNSYIAPCVEVFPVAVERGFSASEDNDEGGGGMVLPEWGII